MMAGKFASSVYVFAYRFYCKVGNFVASNFIHKYKK